METFSAPLELLWFYFLCLRREKAVHDTLSRCARCCCLSGCTTALTPLAVIRFPFFRPQCESWMARGRAATNGTYIKVLFYHVMCGDCSLIHIVQPMLDVWKRVQVFWCFPTIRTPDYDNKSTAADMHTGQETTAGSKLPSPAPHTGTSVKWASAHCVNEIIWSKNRLPNTTAHIQGVPKILERLWEVISRERLKSTEMELVTKDASQP
jgi:hypothetical protein